MDSEGCGICGDELSAHYCETLSCNHTFHYECILKTFQMAKKGIYYYRNRCPYCRTKTGFLPIVNGITKPSVHIHYSPDGPIPPYIPIRCQHVLTRGIHKGDPCNKKSCVGTTLCKVHQPKI